MSLSKNVVTKREKSATGEGDGHGHHSKKGGRGAVVLDTDGKKKLRSGVRTARAYSKKKKKENGGGKV